MRLSASGGGLRNRISTVPAVRRTIPSSSRPCVSRRAVPEGKQAPLEPAVSATGGDGSGDGSSGGRGFGGDGDGDGGFGGNNYYALAAAVPCYDLSAASLPALPRWCTVENCLLLIACLILPVLGVYLKRNSLDKYVLLSLVLTFLPPLGIVFAFAHCFLDWAPLN